MLSVFRAPCGPTGSGIDTGTLAESATSGQCRGGEAPDRTAGLHARRCSDGAEGTRRDGAHHGGPSETTDGGDGGAPRLPRPSLDPVLRLVDVDRLLDHVDVNTLVERVDLNALLERVDINALLARVDLNAVLERVDVEELVQRSDLGHLLLDSTTSVGTRVLDALRSHAVGLDGLLERLVTRVLRRDPATVPARPPR